MKKHLLMALLFLAAACVIASSALAERVSYIEHGWDPEAEKLTTAAKSEECTILDGNETSLTDGWYAAKGTLTYTGQLKFLGNVNLILMDGCKVKAEKGIKITETRTLKIYAQSEGAKMGSLEAVGTNEAAISGGDGLSAAPVEIHGGLVSANGVGNRAAIGGGIGSHGQVTIYGGIVSANHGEAGSGAAIGGSDGQNGSTVNIYGGTVSAFASGKGAAIGGGTSAAGTVNIFGGTVNARSAGSGAAIGGGERSAGTVNIYGGTVNARSAGYGAAIGGGFRSTGRVTISGGIVDAVSANSVAAIGNGRNVSGGFVTVAGGKVRAIGSSKDVLGGEGCSISFSYTNADDFIYVNKSSVAVTLERVFIDAKTNRSVGNADYAGKMLVPYISVLKNYWTGADFILPDELTAVGKNAFAGIPAKAVLVPASVGDVGNSAFADSGVMMIRFLGKNTGIDESAFSGCGMLFAFAPDGSDALNDLRKISNVVPVAWTDEESQ